MIIDLPLLRRQVRRPLGIGGPDGSATDEVADDIVDEWINFSYREMNHRYQFREREIIAITNTERGKRNYPMPIPHEGLRQIDIMHPTSSQHTTLIAMSITDYTNKWNELETAYAYPTHYVRENCLYRLWPTPDAEYELTVRYWGVLNDLTTLNQTIATPDIWWEPIKFGAIARGFMEQGDFTRANINLKLQANMLSHMTTTQTKEEEDYHYAGLEVLGREY